MNELDNKIGEWLKNEGQTEAITNVKKALKCNMAEAKEIVDKYLKGHPDAPVHKVTVKETLYGIGFMIVLILVVWAGCKACGGDSSDSKPTKQLTRKERIENLFSQWDGDQPAVKEWVKAQLNDPESYKQIETKYIDYRDSIAVITDFTCKNGYGGTQRYTCVASIDTLGHFKWGEIHEYIAPQ